MAYETGTASSQEDLISKLFTFATANGWTQDELDLVNDRGSLHNTGGGCFVHFAWNGADDDNIAMAQSLAFSGPSVNIDAHTDDSGNGTEAASLTAERRVSGIGSGSFTSYDFFSSTSPDYVYVVLEFLPGFYRHFGFGEIAKIGDWTGGEFVAGHVWELGVNSDNPLGDAHTILMDGIHTGTTGSEERDPATLHIEGLPNQAGSPGKWANVGNGISSGWRGVDGQGTPEDRSMVIGGIRGGFWVNHFGYMNANLLNGFVPLIPVPLVYQDPTKSIPDLENILLGFMPDIRHIQMKFFSPGQTFVVGSDTWHVFPGVRKRFLADDLSETRNMGIAYKQVP